uniref:Uncharacterized protein n=1 Tax=Daphnia galeata TaxID=27404 RepID=A0A8J2WHT8_9CRUS|nr:unnamed protein product [Daphnia galeata]
MLFQNVLTRLAFIATTLAVVLMFCRSGVQGFASTAFVTSVTTITVTSTSQSLCGKLINVTGACRRRRNFQFERREIQTYDDDFDDTIDLALRGAYFRKQFAPTKTLGMEVTPLVVMPPHSIPSGRNPSVVSHGHLPFGLHSPYPMYSFDSRSKSPYIHPSLFHHQDEAKLQQQQLLQQQRIFFSALSLANLVQQGHQTKTEVKSGTGSFIVVGCTPSPFPFSICNAKAPLPITITPQALQHVEQFNRLNWKRVEETELLDMTEGPYRECQKLTPNPHFYALYPYRPELELADNKSIRYKVAPNLDAKEHFKFYSKWRQSLLQEEDQGDHVQEQPDSHQQVQQPLVESSAGDELVAAETILSTPQLQDLPQLLRPIKRDVNQMMADIDEEVELIGSSPAADEPLTSTQPTAQQLCFSQFNKWDPMNVILTGSTDGVVQMWSLDYVQVPDEETPAQVRIEEIPEAPKLVEESEDDSPDDAELPGEILER